MCMYLHKQIIANATTNTHKHREKLFKCEISLPDTGILFWLTNYKNNNNQNKTNNSYHYFHYFISKIKYKIYLFFFFW